MPHRSKAGCDGLREHTQDAPQESEEHARVELASQDLDEKQREKEAVDREARHTGNNNRFLLEAVLRRMEGRGSGGGNASKA